LEYITVGKLNKSFGTKGQIRVVPEKAFKSDLKNCDVWFVEKAGNLIPYFVENLDESVHFLVKFEDIDAPETAKEITGCILKLRKKDVSYKEDKEGSDLDKLVGFTMKTESGQIIGKIHSIEEYPQQLMAILIDDRQNRILIPLAAEFMIDLDASKSLLIMNLPEGLIESQLGK
jgi:16S rRNA processing protein RimM